MIKPCKKFTLHLYKSILSIIKLWIPDPLVKIDARKK
jgi:hypothetical protein